MAKQEVDVLTALAASLGLAEVKTPPGLEDDEFSVIPGFHTVVEEKPKTKLIKTETLEVRTQKMKAALSTYQFDKLSIRRRRKQRADLQARKEALVFEFKKAVRALNQEQSVLDETRQTDENVILLEAEADTFEKLTDPLGRTARISAQRLANKLEREAFQAEKAAKEAQSMIEQQNSQWLAARGGAKRLKRNRHIDDEAEEAPPGEEEDDL